MYLFLKEPRKFLPQVKPLEFCKKRLQFLVTYMILVTMLTRPKFLFVSHAHFDVLQGWECVVQLSDENLNKLAMKEKFNSLFASLKLNSCCYLSKKKLSDCLRHSVPLDCLNLHPTSSEAESIQYLPTQSDDLERFNYGDDLSFIMSNFNVDDLKRTPSPDSNDFFGDLSSEFKVNNVVSPLKDLLKNASQKRNVFCDENAEFDFTAASLHPERLHCIAEIRAHWVETKPFEIDNPRHHYQIA